MPTFRLMSDLHLEFRSNSGWSKILDMKNNPADVLILAGDIGVAERGELYAFLDVACIHYPSVLMVMGNHEHYSGNFLYTKNIIDAATQDKPNFHLLECDHIDLDGVRYIGATMWTDYNKNNPLTKLHVSGVMSDYRVIKYGDRKLLVDDIYAVHVRTRKYLSDMLDQPFDGIKVVITHHAPNEQSVPNQYKDDVQTNYGYYSDCAELLGKSKYWLHGHMHSFAEYDANGTKVVVNPLGYRNEITNFKNFVGVV